MCCENGKRVRAHTHKPSTDKIEPKSIRLKISNDKIFFTLMPLMVFMYRACAQ